MRRAPHRQAVGVALGTLSAAAPPELASYEGLEVSVRNGPIGWYVQLGGNVSHETLQLKPPPECIDLFA